MLKKFKNSQNFNVFTIFTGFPGVARVAGVAVKYASEPYQLRNTPKIHFYEFLYKKFRKMKKAHRIHALSKIFGPNHSKITELKQADTYFTS